VQLGNTRTTTDIMKILGVTITNGLSVSPHVQSVIASCAQVLLYMPCVFCVPMVYAIVHCKLYISLCCYCQALLCI